MPERSDAFANQVETVVSLFEVALAGRDWLTRRYPKRMRDETGNVYSVLSLTLLKGPIRLLLDPNGYDIPGAEGVMDLYLLPPYDPVATLYLEAGEWFIHSPFPTTLDVIARPTEWPRSPLTRDSINMHWSRSPNMPYLLSEWRGHVQDVLGEFKAARVSVWHGEKLGLLPVFHNAASGAIVARRCIDPALRGPTGKPRATPWVLKAIYMNPP